MILEKVRTLKTWKYVYESIQEKEEHMSDMIAAQFIVEKECENYVEYSQVIKESE